MKRLINVRPSVLVSLLFAIGILLGYAFMCGRYWICILCLTVIIAFFLVFLFLKKQSIWLLLLALIVSCVGGFLTYQRSYIVNTRNRIGCQQVQLTGYITDKSNIENYYLILRNCTITLDDQSTSKLNSQVRLLLYSTTDVDEYVVGYSVDARCTLTDIDIFADGVDTYACKSNVLYLGEHSKIISIQSGKARLNERIRMYVVNKLYTYMSAKSASVMLGMIIGDTSNMSSEDIQAFRTSGISHILAVSGLHLGFIVTVLDQLLRKLKVRHIKRLLIVLPPLIIYSYIVGFTPSVMRALIMTSVLMILRAMSGPRDILTSLFIAGLIILAIQPFYIFDAGFLLSFSAVYGIATVSRILNSYIRKLGTTGLLVNVLSAISVSLGATIGTLPAVAFFYGEVALLGVIVNIIVIPLATACFIITMVTLLPIPLLGYILWAVDKLVWLIRNMVLLVFKLPFASVRVPIVGLEFIVVIILLFIVGGYVNVRGKSKVILCSIMSIVVAVGMIINAIPLRMTDRLYYLDTYSGDCIVAVIDEGQIHIVSDVASLDDVVSILEVIDNYTNSPCYLYIPHFGNTDAGCVNMLLQEIHIKRVALLQEEGNESVKGILDYYDISIGYVGYDEVVVNKVSQCGIVGYIVKCGEMTLMVATRVENVLYRQIYGVDVVVASENAVEVAGIYSNSVVISDYYEENENILLLSSCGNFTCWQKRGIISIDI
ncbi:MAG: ComEC/Rec2 family competence protein [Clostridia bacterium]|nr:ComEC/Rec2 family competence protein [Clostridia bacterium]